MRIWAGFFRATGVVCMVAGLVLSVGASTVLADETTPPDQLTDPISQPADTPPADTPPADTPPADTPPADTPPADTPPADTPPADTPQSFSVQSNDIGTLANAGDVKIHDVTEATSLDKDNPKPCDPVLVAFNFNLPDQYTYQFQTQPGGVVVSGPTTVNVTTDPQQNPPSGDFRPPLVDGQQYKLVWDFGASIGTTGAKQKVFKIDCGLSDLTIEKTQSGFSEGDTFEVAVDCTNNLFDKTFTFTVAANGDAIPSPSPAVVQDIPEGVTCTVTETETGNPNSDQCDVATTVNAVEGTELEDVDPSELGTVTFDNTLTCDAQVTSEVHNTPSHTDVTDQTFPLGSTFHDKAIVEGAGPTPTGTVDFTFYKHSGENGPCDSDDVIDDSSNPESDVALSEESAGTATAESSDFTPATVGDYAYKVHYDGDAVYGTGDGPCEPFHVTAIPTHDLTIEKTESGFSEGDTFQVHVDCTDDAYDTTFTFTVDSNGDAVPDVDPPTVGSIPEGVTCTVTETETGNPNSDQCDVATTVNAVEGTELEDVDPSELGTVTFDNTLTCDAQVTSEVHNTPSHTDVTDQTFPLGSTFHDKAIVEGAGPTPTGTVDFTFYKHSGENGPCDSDDVIDDSSNPESDVALSEESAGTATAESSDFTPATVGDYAYKVHYDGDAVYGTGDGPCEPFHVTEVVRSVPTTASEVHNSPNHTDVTDGVFTLGATFHDKAIVGAPGGGATPTGTVDFALFKQSGQNDPCDLNDVIDTESDVALSEESPGTATAESSDFTPLTVGDYAYQVHYDGDDAYNAGLGPCEPFHVIEEAGRSTPTVTSQVHNPQHQDITNQEVPVGTQVHDKAIVTGNGIGIPTGTVDFAFFDNGTCAGAPSDTQSDVALGADGTAESSPRTPSAGFRAFLVHYDGDEVYTAGDGPCEAFDPTEVVEGASVSSLPFTGGGGGWPVPVGVLLALTGAALAFIGRRRRTVKLES